MEEQQKQAILSAVRTGMGVVGGILTTYGWADEEMIAQLTGALMILIPFFWGVWDKYNAEAKTKERETVAVNVGIAVADRTLGVTPPISAERTPEVIAAFAPVAGVADAGVTQPPKVTPQSPVLPPPKK